MKFYQNLSALRSEPGEQSSPATTASSAKLRRVWDGHATGRPLPEDLYAFTTLAILSVLNGLFIFALLS